MNNKPIDLDHLEALAKAATPGPWAFGSGYGAAVVFPPQGDEPLAIDMSAPDAKFIAYANPATILELIKLARGGG